MTKPLPNGTVIAGTHKAVSILDGETNNRIVALMPIWKLEQLGYNVSDGVPVVIEGELRRVAKR